MFFRMRSNLFVAIFQMYFFLQPANVSAASPLKTPPAALFTALPCLQSLLSLVHLWFNYSSALRAGHTWGSVPRRSGCLSAVVISLALIQRCSAALCRKPQRAGRGRRARRSPASWSSGLLPRVSCQVVAVVREWV